MLRADYRKKMAQTKILAFDWLRSTLWQSIKCFSAMKNLCRYLQLIWTYEGLKMLEKTTFQPTRMYFEALQFWKNSGNEDKTLFNILKLLNKIT